MVLKMGQTDFTFTGFTGVPQECLLIQFITISAIHGPLRSSGGLAQLPQLLS